MIPMQTSAKKLVGALLNGRFRLQRLLGEGGMGAVYAAEDTQDGGRVAIKLLHPELVEDSAVVQRFFIEAHALRNLEHPALPRIHGAASAESGQPYLVMDLLEGHSLATWLGKRVHPEDIVPLLREALEALSAAHARGIVHRDLKPENLFVTVVGKRYALKVLDFGIAKVMDAAGGLGSRTNTGALLGTPAYMSPEQIREARSVDTRSDLWSLAVVLYELLTGRLPFQAANEFARLTVILEQEAPPVGSLVPELIGWEAFFLRALAKDPERRFQSAEEMQQSLLEHARTQVRVSHTGTVVFALAPPGEEEAAPAPVPSTLPHPTPTAVPDAAPSPAAPTPPAAAPTGGGTVAIPRVGMATTPSARGPSPASTHGGHAGQAGHAGGRDGRVITHASARWEGPGVEARAEPSARVEVREPRPRAPSLSLPKAALLALACLGIGFLAGYLVGRS